jgi:hypothetical protein
MRKFLKCLAVAAVAAIGLPAFADTLIGLPDVSWSYASVNHYSGNGGEFTLTATNANLPNTYYDAKAKNQDGNTSFQSFCLEEGENIYFHPNEANGVVISDTFINEGSGAVTGGGAHAVKGGNTYGDNLDAKTAYLYANFAKGILAGYDYTLSGRAASAGALQNAIWYIEGEGGLASGLATTFYNNAVAGTSPGSYWEQKFGDGVGPVRVLNLYTPGVTMTLTTTTIGGVPYYTYAPPSTTDYRQDQLYMAGDYAPPPVPSPAVAGGFITLLGIGMMFRRRKI